jgi:2-ketoarginine methyltransferase
MDSQEHSAVPGASTVDENPGGKSPVWPGFEDDLVGALWPIRGFAFATALHHFFSTGLFDLLAASDEPRELVGLAREARMDGGRVTGFMEFLANEGVVAITDASVELTDTGRQMGAFRAWYTVFIGGYGNSFLEIGDGLASDAQPVTRDLGQVGVGSCGISHYDAVPLTGRLMNYLPPV